MNPIDHLKSHLTKDYLERLSSTALASAGFSAGLLLLLLESKSDSISVEISIWFSILALILSLYGWQYFLPFIVHGESTYKKINVFHIAALQTVVVLSLLTVVTVLVWNYSALAGAGLAISAISMGVLVIKHNIKVSDHCNGK